MTGASVNFKAVKSAGHAVSHASREVAPTYLLPTDKSMGTVVVLDDAGKVSQILEAKMALASPRAKVDKRYSPVWEGILNLRRPEAGEDPEEYRAECGAVVTDWYKQYEAATGHKVLRVDVHLDEGHMVDGEAVLNAHAHVIADRTNDLGRVIKLSPKQLRELQTMTAEVTQLERGKSSFETGRKHISHQSYKYLAELGRLETQQVKVKLGVASLQVSAAKQQKIDWMDTANAARDGLSLSKIETAKLQAKLDGEPERLAAALAAQEEKYRLDREAMKASGTAKQADYQALKKAHDAELAQMKKERDEAVAALKITNQKVETMTTQITQLQDDNAELAAEAAKWAAKANAYQVEKGKGTPAHLIDTTGVAADPAPLTPAPVIGPNERARLRALEATKTTLEAPKQVQGGIPSPTPSKTPREAFLELYGHIKTALVDLIDGMRLDAADGRLGLFSSHRSTGPRVQVLCEVPDDKVMPEIGKTFEGRARSGKGGLGD